MSKNIIVVIFLFLLSTSICGCVPLLVAGGVAGGVGTQAWVSGKLVQDVNAPFEMTVQATKSALDSLGLIITSEIQKQRVAQIKSKYIDGETIWIDIHRISQPISRVAVRVGTVPDQEAAVEILNKIKHYLSQ